jgi:hypothetical protein
MPLAAIFLAIRPPPSTLSLISLLLPHDGRTQPTAQGSQEVIRRDQLGGWEEAKVATIIIDPFSLGGVPPARQLTLHGQVQLTKSGSDGGIGWVWCGRAARSTEYGRDKLAQSSGWTLGVEG